MTATAIDIPASLTFRPNHVGYCPDNACIMAYLASWAYQDPQQLVLDRLGCTKCYTIPEQQGTHAFVAIRDDSALVFFRGTERDPMNWKTNFNIPFDAADPGVSGVGGKTHKGFWKALNAVWSQDGAGLFDILVAHCANKPIWFAGHSLGGALAVLAASRVQAYNNQTVGSHLKIAGIHTFGQPRTGDGAFATWYNDALMEKTFRFINAADLVTMVPSRITLGYSHVGQFLYFTKAGDLTNDMSAWRFLEDHLDSTLLNVGLQVVGVADHSMDAYVDRLLTNIDHQFLASQLHTVP